MLDWKWFFCAKCTRQFVQYAQWIMAVDMIQLYDVKSRRGLHGKNKVSISNIVIPENDVRLKERSQETINTYADNLSLLPPIEVAPCSEDGHFKDEVGEGNEATLTHYRILDGVHRFMAHQKADVSEIEVKVFKNVVNESGAIEHGVKANAAHGVPLTSAEIKHNCIRLCELGRSNVEISKIVRRHETVVGKYVRSTKERIENELANKVGKMYDIRDDNGNRIYSQEKLGEEIGASSKRAHDLLNRYNALRIRDILKEVPELYDEHGELAQMLSVDEKAVDRAFNKYPAIVESAMPEPEPEPVEEEVDGEPEEEAVESPSPSSVTPRAPIESKPKMNGAKLNTNRTVSTEDVGGEDGDEWDFDEVDDDDEDWDGDEIDFRHISSFIDDCSRIEATEIPVDARKIKAIGVDEDGVIWFYTGHELAEFQYADGLSVVYQ